MLQRPRHGRRIGSVGVLLIALLGAGCGGRPQAPATGVVQDRTLPPSVMNLPLQDQEGRTATLAGMKGDVVVLVDFLTSCQEVCPITTGALQEMEQALRAADPGAGVRFVEVTVDPGRDTPKRLAAYRRLAGVDFTLLTGRSSDLAALWKDLGVAYQEVPEGSPPGTDWFTGEPYTYDVTHTDGLFLLDAKGHLRYFTGGTPRLSGSLEPALGNLLNETGRQNLADTAAAGWSVDEGLQALGWLLGKTIPPPS